MSSSVIDSVPKVFPPQSLLLLRMLMRLKPRHLQDCAPSEGSRGESMLIGDLLSPNSSSVVTLPPLLCVLNLLPLCIKILVIAFCCCFLAQSYLTLCDPMDCVARQAPLSMGILQARILKWVAMPSCRGSSQSRD